LRTEQQQLENVITESKLPPAYASATRAQSKDQRTVLPTSEQLKTKKPKKRWNHNK
jgi:hypothetical protein